MFVIIVLGNALRNLWPWSPYLGICCGLAYGLGRLVSIHDEKKHHDVS